MKNQTRQFGHFLFKAVAPSFGLMFLCSCTSSVYDMRQLDQPVVLNNNPFLISRTAASPKLVRIDTYSAEVNGLEAGSQNATTTTINTAQLNAFLKIGGDPNCSIRNVSLDTTCGWGFLSVLEGGADIEATGEVAQIQTPLLRPPPGPMSQSPTNRPALPATVQK